MDSNLHIIILAAGQGSRMKSNLPKVLHKLAGKPLLHHVLDTALALSPEKIHVVYGHGGDQVKQACSDYSVSWVHQASQNGTGHAVGLALQKFDNDKQVLILYGDVPLLTDKTLRGLLAVTDQLSVLTTILDDPSGYGRIIRTNKNVVGIVEDRDADEAQQKIMEINTGIMSANAGLLSTLLKRVNTDNSQGEIYLTDVVALANADNIVINSMIVEDSNEVSGVNDKLQLSRLERIFQNNLALKLMSKGVQILDENRFDVRGVLSCGKDVEIDVNCVFEGNVTLGNGVKISANCYIKDCNIGELVVIKPNSVIEDSSIGASCTIGPFSRLRPGTNLEDNVHIGNFVEVKNSSVSESSKINHLSYIGDADVGSSVNIGAGTITCNYDGANKHRTKIGDNAFIGSGTELVAPVEVGRNATVGAGSTITKAVQENTLGITRSKQQSVTNWVRPSKKPKD